MNSVIVTFLVFTIKKSTSFEQIIDKHSMLHTVHKTRSGKDYL